MNNIICLITGCRLLDPDNQRSVHGDLHMIEDGASYIFNAVLTPERVTAWIPFGSIDDYGERNCITVRGPTFERRGVIVFAVSSGSLNSNALEYIAKWNKVSK